jgi:hypothetical protein
MSRPLSQILVSVGLLALVAACTREAEPPTAGLLQHVPADTPYVFVNSRKLPKDLGEKLADHYATQLAVQRASFGRMREQLEDSPDAAAMAHTGRQLFEVLDALFAEFEGRGTAAQLRELGIEPVTRSALYGIGVLPAVRVEIADAERLNAMLDRVEQRAQVSALRGELAGQSYRRIDLGPIDAVLSVTAGHLVGGLLVDALFDQHLPLLLGQELPDESLAKTGSIEALIDRHGFTGYGEGYVKLDDLVAILLGKGSGRNAAVMQALAAPPLPVSTGCMRMTEQLLAGMPRMVMGITQADERRLTARGIWESSPVVAGYLQKLAAPVPGVGNPYSGLLAVGMGIDLPQLRNAIDALLRQVVAAGESCEWVDPAVLQAAIPQLNLILGPMTAGIKGFNLQLDDLDFDPQTFEPTNVRAGLLAAVDDPRGVFALGAMFNPALAALEIPSDGSLVDLPRDLGLDEQTPPLKVAIKDKALLLLAGSESADMMHPLFNAVPLDPAPLFAIDYGIHRLMQRFSSLLDRMVAQLAGQGEAEMARELEDQLQGFRLQAEIFDRLRISVHANADGLVMDQVMELR